ncbi:hypothetical protein AB2M62_07855 [Sphingomonas sp. MMS12-HWE2-04]|uniref:hypothetical protein n=1 Tax=Sphingomonas sp. MMS12-HWE2-04 TaxID=3234199 RepID=UPI00385100FA
MRRLTLPALVALVLAGCAQSTRHYPSLLPRAGESPNLAEPERTVPTATPDPVLDSQLATLTGALTSNGQRFAAAAQDTEAKVAVARGVAIGSDAWLNAQTALSGLASLRAPTLSTLAELEEMAIQRGEKGLVPYPALDAAVQSARTLATEQDRRIDALDAALSGK